MLYLRINFLRSLLQQVNLDHHRVLKISPHLFINREDSHGNSTVSQKYRKLEMSGSRVEISVEARVFESTASIDEACTVGGIRLTIQRHTQSSRGYF